MDKWAVEAWRYCRPCGRLWDTSRRQCPQCETPTLVAQLRVQEAG
jgi:RNA polymerase subunit RPABC4/transcription elongation factor Spt4